MGTKRLPDHARTGASGHDLEKTGGESYRKWKPILGEDRLVLLINGKSPSNNQALDAQIAGVHRCWRCGRVFKDYPTAPKFEFIRMRQALGVAKGGL